MPELAKRESQTWQNVGNLIQRGYAAGNYDEATALLVKLHQLAEFQGAQASFDVRLEALVEKYKSRSALLARWKKWGLV